MKKTIFFLMVILISYSLVFAEEIVTTKDGKQVLLKDDNTWEYVNNQNENSPSPAPKAINAKYAEEAVEIWDTTFYFDRT